MDQKPWYLNLANIERANTRGHAAIEYAKKLVEDPQRQDRRKAGLCRLCHYGGSIGGSAMTSRPCGGCNEEQLYPSTATDALCAKCAQHYDLCRHCGADREYKGRRKLDRRA